jgi:hypothetical protein
MNLDDFLNASAPADDWPPALKALWHAEQGEWDTAHTLSQQGDTAEGAWVHANLHREEGDLGNARYWYSRAGKPESQAAIEEERRDIIRALLG